MGRSRNLLHKSKLTAFREWAEANGYPTRETNADFQVLQVRFGGRYYPIYDRLEAPEHYSVPATLEHLVIMFIKSQHAALQLPKPDYVHVVPPKFYKDEEKCTPYWNEATIRKMLARLVDMKL